MDKKRILDKILQATGIILLFMVIAYAFVPEVLSGKIVNQADISGWTGMAQEIVEYNEEHPEDPSLWTNSMFGGMPTISIHSDFHGDWTQWIYDLLLTGARPATYLFISLLGAFLLMLSFGIRPVLAVAGAIAITFCSYNLQIIQVGHNTKMQAIAYMPWVLAAMVYTYRSAMSGIAESNEKGLCRKRILKTILGSVLFGFALSFQIKANHPQISYYLAIIILVYVLALLIHVLRSPDRKRSVTAFFATSFLLLAVGLTGICTNLNKLLPTWEYAEYSMRGGSELGQQEASEGLDLDYATAWSYGLEETPNLLIPNFNGGASSGNPGLKDSAVKDLLIQAHQPNIDAVMDSLPLYWGPQPFTAGPMYMGAVTIFLFILGLLTVRSREKWWLAVCTVLAILLAWGSHFMWFTKLWYDFAPLYNKFRTVSMALVVLQITLPLLGFLALDRIWKNNGGLRSNIYVAYGITAGICLIFAAAPGIAGSFSGTVDSGIQDILAEALREDRRAMLVKDALRSFVLVTLAFGLLWWSLRSKSERNYTIAGVGMAVLVLFDLGGVGKRYLNSDDFVSRREFSSQFNASEADKIILADEALDYRVLSLAVNTFNDSHTSYWHKSIGGYSPAKMQRYQDLIEWYLSPEINRVIRTVNSSATVQEVEEALDGIPVISMLNGKYIIIDGSLPPVENRHAFGNCWLVSSAVAAGSPDEEIELIGETELRDVAVIGEDFAWALERFEGLESSSAGDTETSVPMLDSVDYQADTVWMTSYEPNELRYKSRLSTERAVIFSEIYYPHGWYLTIDGEPAEIFRADWILRGAFIPAGEHEIVMRFDPPVYKTGAAVSRASSIVLYVLLLMSSGALIASGCRKKE